ncbi:MAG: tetratricopeptide repeat protein [Vampirovibrio sp.]
MQANPEISQALQDEADALFEAVKSDHLATETKLGQKEFDYESTEACQAVRKAIEGYTKVLELNPNHKRAYNNRGIGKRYLKDYEGALADLNQAHALDPNWPIVYANLANVYRSLKQFDKALCLY